MPRFQLIIFDCDGVLVDSEPLGIAVMKLMTAKVGWHLSEPEIVERFIGRSHAHMVQEIEAHTGRRIPPEWSEECRALTAAAFERSLTPIDGIVDVLGSIDIPFCVASSGSHRRLQLTLGLTGLYSLFEGRIFSADDVPNGKPAPDLFLHAARRSGVDPEDCAVVEDSASGVLAAQRAGMRAFGYFGGVTSAARLTGYGAVLFGNMRELPMLLDSGR